MAELREDPVHENRYFVSEATGKPPALGAEVSDSATDLSVYWSCNVSRTQMLAIVREAAESLSKEFLKRPPVGGKFVAYGKDMRVVFAIRDDEFVPEEKQQSTEGKPPLESFDACRAELKSPSGTVVVWANVNGPVRKSLEDGGQNVGVSVPQDIFETASQSFIAHAIELTLGMKRKAVSSLLEEFSGNLLPRRRPAAG